MFTIRLAGAFLLLSGAIALLSCTSEVAFLGAMRSGIPAIAYNLFFALLYLAMGTGLIAARVWGYRLLMVGTAVYSIDRLAFLVDSRTRAAAFASGGMTTELQSMIDMNLIDQGVILITIATLVCWWGFALFIYWKRDMFLLPAVAPTLGTLE